MLIDCPYCGARPSEEFTYPRRCHHGAAVRQSSLATWKPGTTMSIIRDNPKGRHREYWHHTGGCRAWLVVERDTLTHQVYAVTARDWASTGAHDQPSSGPGRTDRSGAAASLHLRSASTSPALPAIRWPRRCSPMACMLMARIFKYHRPRGVMTAGAVGAQCAGRDRRGRPPRGQHPRHHGRASMTGSSATSQNRWPSLDFDLGAVNGACRRRSSSPASTTRPSCGRRASGRRSTSR